MNVCINRPTKCHLCKQHCRAFECSRNIFKSKDFQNFQNKWFEEQKKKIKIKIKIKIKNIKIKQIKIKKIKLQKLKLQKLKLKKMAEF